MTHFTNQNERIRRTLENALSGASYAGARSEEGGRMVVIEALRSDGRRIGLRFRGVSRSDANFDATVGEKLQLRSVGRARFGILGLLFGGGQHGVARVRIDAGKARFDIVCQDAEWWEEP